MVFNLFSICHKGNSLFYVFGVESCISHCSSRATPGCAAAGPGWAAQGEPRLAGQQLLELSCSLVSSLRYCFFLCSFFLPKRPKSHPLPPDEPGATSSSPQQPEAALCQVPAAWELLPRAPSFPPASPKCGYTPFSLEQGLVPVPRANRGRPAPPGTAPEPLGPRKVGRTKPEVLPGKARSSQSCPVVGCDTLELWRCGTGGSLKR